MILEQFLQNLAKFCWKLAKLAVFCPSFWHQFLNFCACCVLMHNNFERSLWTSKVLEYVILDAQKRFKAYFSFTFSKSLFRGLRKAIFQKKNFLCLLCATQLSKFFWDRVSICIYLPYQWLCRISKTFFCGPFWNLKS